MSASLAEKARLLNHLKADLLEKIEGLKEAISSARASRDVDTKSSAGDKYETGRAMMEIELGKREKHLQQALEQLRVLNQVNEQKVVTSGSFGSLITTNRGIFFIALGLGVIKTTGGQYFCISMASPIGQLLKDKVVGDRFDFQNNEFEVLGIV